MTITNKLSLPGALVRAVSEERPQGEWDYSITQLIQPPRLKRLYDLHKDEIEEDVIDRIWMLFGSAVHYVIEQYGDESELTEKRLIHKIHGYRVAGKPDTLHLATGILDDYKTTSVWSIVFGGKADWESQLNCYAYLCYLAGHTVTKLRIIALLRDWSERKAEEEAANNREWNVYPSAQVAVLDIPLWPWAKTDAYIDQQLLAHENAILIANEAALPLCSDEERWKKPDTWAVMKRGIKRAVRVLDSQEKAAAFSASTPGTMVEHRPGQDSRCLKYCPVRTFCSHARSLRGQENAD